ncbi:PBCV-specific basic adaptor domain-containing protein [Only Syngen Nebraska virus 5]|uniref:PBCV-specific basic adaptor domain-containing protein n=1 Tax=Only Syngen Nebraska virus 5 TaxID=1917232 RepID=UPI000901945F|nr:PBCV-specific basic adaptor domain-containing protein [Only Syngen Nebraska virus 5]APC25735.1 PBCV-specific basic adaptor domain-containing protein [Only Syngen Nebraska virus 5]
MLKVASFSRALVVVNLYADVMGPNLHPPQVLPLAPDLLCVAVLPALAAGSFDN